MGLDVYVYGMTVLSTIHRLAGGFDDFDGYAEIAETRTCPGGEGMNAALLLSKLGLRVGLGGPHWGAETEATLARYAEAHEIDVSGIGRDHTYGGVRDVVIVGAGKRLVLGEFQRFFSESNRRWNAPSAEMIRAARVVALDPFFGERSEGASELCFRHGPPYVTIDCAYDGSLHARAQATVISREYRRQNYVGVDERELLARYVERAAKGASVVFTSGSEPIWYSDGNGGLGSFAPQPVDVKSTLGAGRRVSGGPRLWRPPGLLGGGVCALCGSSSRADVHPISHRRQSRDAERGR